MFVFLKNLFIAKSGLLLVNNNYGNCHSLNVDVELLSGFFWALQGVSQKIAGSSIRTMDFEDLSFHFHHDSTYEDIRFIVITDCSDDYEEVQEAIFKISKLFFKLYSESITNFRGIVSIYDEFGDILVKKGIVEKNCGTNCDYCQCNKCEKSCDHSKIVAFFLNKKQKYLKAVFEKGKKLDDGPLT